MLTLEEVEGDLSLYKCDKEVKGLEITDVSKTLFSVTGIIEGKPKSISLGKDFFAHNSPEVGSYLVVYKDGYVSCSPKEAFEDGYTLIETPEE